MSDSQNIKINYNNRIVDLKEPTRTIDTFTPAINTRFVVLDEPTRTIDTEFLAKITGNDQINMK